MIKTFLYLQNEFHWQFILFCQFNYSYLSSLLQILIYFFSNTVKMIIINQLPRY